MKIRLVVLGLLMRGPRHGYELTRALETPPFAPWADVYPGSIYHALKVLERDGRVQVKQTERTGHRLKATYAITPAGRAEFLELVQEGWSEAPRSFPTGLYASLAFLEHLPRETLREVCDVLIAKVETMQREWMEREAERSTVAVLPAHQRLFYENAREHLEADLRLLRALRNLAGPAAARASGAQG